MMRKQFVRFDTVNFVKEISNNTLNKNAILIIDVSTMIDINILQTKNHYIDIKYKIFDMFNNLLYETPENIIFNHRYPNKAYMCLTQKFGRKLSRNGCYIFDNIENLNKIKKIKFYFCSAHNDDPVRNSICLIFNIKPNYINENTYAIIHLGFCLQNAGIYLNTSSQPKNDIYLNMFDRNENIIRNRIDKNSIQFSHICELESYNIN